MLTCTFLGHRDVYDRDIYERVLKAIYQIVKANDAVEFLFAKIRGFYGLCILAALNAKRHHPQKTVTITIALESEKASPAIPSCLYDRLIFPSIPAPKNESDVTAGQKKLMRWTFQHSTHLICYLYPAFFAPEQQHFSYVQKRGLAILEITSKETAKAITEHMSCLSEKEQFILRELLGGKTQKAVGEVFGITSSAISFQAHRAGSKLCKGAKVNLSELFVGSIFSIESATYEAVCLFKKMVLFLLACCNVRQFWIASEYAHSEYVEVLTELSQSFPYQGIEITLFPCHPQSANGQTLFNIEDFLYPVF